MSAMQCGRRIGGLLMVVGAFAAPWAMAEQPSKATRFSRAGRSNPAPAAPAPSEAQGELRVKSYPVNPNEAIAVINGEEISRTQLADECVARKGVEILDTMIARKLIEQALKAKKLEVTATEIDQEIDKVANQVAHLGREAWLRTLDKERGISPMQYARDIIYPALALRKLAAPSVQVTPQDMKNAFEAQYGDKLRCRLIMVDTLPKAQEIWEELRKNPGGFEKLAQERSMDTGSRSLGGLLAEPMARHAYPQNVSDSAFSQLVDGDPKDKDKDHKPKNGDFTGPIQVAQSTWIILRREGVIDGQNVDFKDEKVRKQTYEMIYEVKLKEKMGEYYVAMMKASAIDNKLTGTVKLANEEHHPDHQTDGDVRLMSDPGQGDAASPGTSPGVRAKLPNPAAMSPEVLKQAESMQRPPSRK